MKKQVLSLSVLAVSSLAIAQQIPFTDQSALLPSATFHSGNAVAVCDMNNDQKDDIVRASGNTIMYIEYQQASNASFTEQSFANSFGSPWGMCVGDIDNNGYNDVFYGTGSNTRILNANATGTAYATVQVNALTGAGSIFVQGCNFADINSDGYLDMLVCNDVAMPHIYMGDGTDSGWVFNQAVMPLATSPASDNSGNYASIWTDVNADGLIDLMITHCRQGVNSPLDARRIDQVFINNGNGTYTQDVTNWTNLRDGAQGWSTAWGDIDNDGDMDALVLNYDVNSTLLINNGSGIFTDTISTSGISNTTSFFGMNATFQDFDNDGFLDVMFTGDNHYLYKGNGNGTFTQVSPNPWPYSNYTITSHAIGDLNNDGFLDVYGSYCDIYNSASTRNDKLWMNDCPNQGNTNHWVKFNLVGGAVPGMSNKNGVGAIVKIYGPWGVQVREVRSGEAYGIQNSFTMHFGLGQNTQIDSTVVIWPSGIVDHMMVLNGDASYTVLEGQSPLATSGVNSKPFSIGVFPNPAVQSDVTIRLNNFAQYGLNNLSLNVYDLSGKLVYSEANLQNSIITLGEGTLSNGMYFVEVLNGDVRVGSEKVLVQ